MQILNCPAGGLDDGFSVRDVYRNNWSLLNTKEMAKEACDELVEANWLREVVTPSVFLKKGKTTYLINPKAKSENA